MPEIAFDEMQLTIHEADYYALPANVRSMMEMYSCQFPQRTKYGLVFVLSKSRWPEIEKAMNEAPKGK